MIRLALLTLCAISLGGCGLFGKPKANSAEDGIVTLEEQAEGQQAEHAGGENVGGEEAQVASTDADLDADDVVATPEVATGEVATPESSEKGGQSTAQAAPSPAPVAKRPKRPKMKEKAVRPYESGKAAFDSGDLAGAKKQFAAAISADSKAYEAHYHLGVIYERLGKDDKAIKSYRRALSAAPDHGRTLATYALLLARQEKYDAALKVIDSVAQKWGATARLLAAKSEVRSMQGQSGQAQELAQQALKKNPASKAAMIALARDHYRARRIDLALYALTGILDGYGEGNPPRDKKNAEARLLRGLIYRERGLRGPAMDDMQAAVEERPDLVEAHLVLATFMMEAGNAKDARRHLEQAVRYDNANVAAHLQLGDAYRLLGRTEDARRELEWVLAAQPNQAAAHYNLGLLFLLNKKVQGLSEMQTIDKAILHLEAYKARAGRGGPDDVDDLITRAKTNKAILQSQQGEG